MVHVVTVSLLRCPRQLSVRLQAHCHLALLQIDVELGDQHVQFVKQLKYLGQMSALTDPSKLRLVNDLVRLRTLSACS